MREIEWKIINLYNEGKVEEAYDLLYSDPKLAREAEEEDRTACEMVEFLKELAEVER